jgi:hypothetical protein
MIFIMHKIKINNIKIIIILTIINHLLKTPITKPKEEKAG